MPVWFRHLCSKKLLYPDSIVVYGLIAEIVHVADSLGVAAGEVLGGKEEPLVLVVGQLLDIGILRVLLHGLPSLLDDLRRKAVGGALEVLERGGAGVDAGVEPHHLSKHHTQILVLDELRDHGVVIAHVGIGIVVGVLCTRAGDDIGALGVCGHLRQQLIGVFHFLQQQSVGGNQRSRRAGADVTSQLLCTYST